MKTVAIGDIHGRSVWKLIIDREKPDKVVFIGDEFDSHDDFTALEQLHNFNEIAAIEGDIIRLIGNHTHHYYPEVGSSGTSGYQSLHAIDFGHAIMLNRDKWQMAYAMDDILFSHAGVSKLFLDQTGYSGDYFAKPIAEYLNEIWIDTPRVFSFYGTDPYGDDICQTPIWIRPRSLMRANKNINEGLIQVVGHTQQKCIDIEGKATGGRYYFIDTLGTSGEYLIIEDGEFSTGTIN